MNEDDHVVLAQQDMQTLAKWWCLLNSFDWPVELPNPEPETHVPGGRRWRLMEWIEHQIGHRQCNREWNRDMTDEEHNDFWRGAFEGNAEARERDRRRREQKVRATLGRS